MPAEHVRASLIEAGTYMKSKVGSKTKSMKSIVAAAFMVEPYEILLPDYDQVDKRSTVNRVNKARVIVIRPKWSHWNVKLRLDCMEESVTKETIQKLFEYAGSYVGLGSFRPGHSGLFGRFRVEAIEPVSFLMSKL